MIRGTHRFEHTTDQFPVAGTMRPAKIAELGYGVDQHS